jgi:hypothetical protein
MNVHSATCSCSVELYKLRYTLADFFPNWNFRVVFSILLPFIYVPLPSVCSICMSVIQQTVYILEEKNKKRYEEKNKKR